MTLYYKFSFVQNLISFRVAQLVKANHAVGREWELCVRLTFISFVNFLYAFWGKKIWVLKFSKQWL